MRQLEVVLPFLPYDMKPAARNRVHAVCQANELQI
jgi:hypothetical protein